MIAKDCERLFLLYNKFFHESELALVVFVRVSDCVKQ
jgi:hypothetical protein